MNKLHSQSEWIARAQAVLPAGGFGNFDPSILISHGHGSRVWDEDGREYIDYLIGSGPMLLGHGHPEVMEAVLEQLPKGMTFFANNTKGVELAEEITRAVPCCEQVRFVASGGEADMYAIRLARAYEEALAPHDIMTAQVLVTLEDSADRRRYLNSLLSEFV